MFTSGQCWCLVELPRICTRCHHETPARSNPCREVPNQRQICRYTSVHPRAPRPPPPPSETTLVCQGLLIIEALRSHSHTPHSVGLLWTGDRPSDRLPPDNTKHPEETAIHAPAGFEPTIPASNRPQTHALDRAATGIVPAIHYRS